MENIRKLAVEAGYDDMLDATYAKSDWQIVSELEFWLAVKKSLGWYDWRCYCGAYYQGARRRKGLPQGVRPRVCSNCNRDARMIKPSEQANWHRFIDHLAKKKDIGLFFSELLKDNG